MSKLDSVFGKVNPESSSNQVHKHYIGETKGKTQLLALSKLYVDLPTGNTCPLFLACDYYTPNTRSMKIGWWNIQNLEF